MPPSPADRTVLLDTIGTLSVELAASNARLVTLLHTSADRATKANGHLGCTWGRWWRDEHHSPLCRTLTELASVWRLHAQFLENGLGLDKGLADASNELLAAMTAHRAAYDAANRRGHAEVSAWARGRRRRLRWIP